MFFSMVFLLVKPTELGTSLFEIAQSLLSEPLFWERWRSIRIGAKSDERTDKIQILSGSLMSDTYKDKRAQ